MQIQTHRSKETSIQTPETKRRYHWRIHQYRSQEHVHLKQYVENYMEHQYNLQNTKTDKLRELNFFEGAKL
jgi:hypothetical protein